MNVRKWLVRTTHNQIFGPISKEKVLKLYQDKSISPDDEICMGNGHWFHIREIELLKKYLLNDEEHSPPTSMRPGQKKWPPHAKKEVKLPGPDDLDYPELVSGPKTDPTVSQAPPRPNSPQSSPLPKEERPPPPSQLKPQRDDRYLMVLFIISLILLGLLLKKYAHIL